MVELYDFHEVSTTALIDEVKQYAGMDYLNAALYGDINYSEDVDLMAEKAKRYSLYTSGEVLATRSLNRGTWDLLPGTKEEVETIAEMLRGKGINVYMFTQNDANEESLKAFDGHSHEQISEKGKYKHPNYSVAPYIELLKNDYLVNGKTEYDLMDTEYVNKHGKRYASSESYEKALLAKYTKIRQNTKIDSLSQETNKYKMFLGL
jgi:hypothetical protein